MRPWFEEDGQAALDVATSGPIFGGGLEVEERLDRPQPAGVQHQLRHVPLMADIAGILEALGNGRLHQGTAACEAEHLDTGVPDEGLVALAHELWKTSDAAEVTLLKTGEDSSQDHPRVRAPEASSRSCIGRGLRREAEAPPQRQEGAVEIGRCHGAVGAGVAQGGTPAR